MAAYLIRNLDNSVWAKLKRRAEGEGRTVRAVVLSLIARYASGEIGFEAEERKRAPRVRR